MRAPSALVVSVLAGLLTACNGSIGDGGSAGNGPTGSSGAGGGASDQAAPDCTKRPALGADHLRLLTKREYEATLRDIFGATAIEAVTAQLAQLPEKRVAHGFRSMAKGTTGSEVEGFFTVGDAVAIHLTASPARLAALSPCLGAATVETACVGDLVAALGERLYRRPLAPEELSALTTLYAEGAAISPSDGVRFVIFSMLQAPPFLYRLELAGVPRADDPNTFDLTGHESAARLSYLAWGSAPDAQLLQSAASGTLATPVGFGNELDRLLSDPRAAARLGQFFSEWLETEELPTVNQTAEYLAGVSAEGLAIAMKDEANRFVNLLAFEGQGTFRDLFTSNVSFLGSPDLAKIYGVQPSTAPDGRVELDATLRGGILTRAALLLTNGEETSPIRRGAFVRRKLLCDPIPPPDPNAFPPGAIQPPEFSPAMTNRQRWTAKTGEGVCRGCHGILNPFGFALENYDNIGRYRTSEAIIDPATGMKVNELAIDAGVDAPLADGLVHVSGAVGLGAALADSAQAQACFGRQWFRFVNGREETTEDACVLADVVGAVARGDSIRETLKRLALAPEFRIRRLATK